MPDLKTIISTLNDIIKLIKRLPNQIRSRKIVNHAETALIMANSTVLYYKSARHVIKIPYLKRLTNFDVKRFTRTVLRHFPIFMGSRITAEGDEKDFEVRFTAKNVPISSILKALCLEIEKLLEWEISIVGDALYYRFRKSEIGIYGIIFCVLSVEDFVYDPGG